MDYALECLKPRLLHFAQSSPLPVYAIALRYELKDVVLGAAKLFLRLHAPYPYTEELEEITGGAYHRLLKYREVVLSSSDWRDRWKTGMVRRPGLSLVHSWWVM